MKRQRGRGRKPGGGSGGGGGGGGGNHGNHGNRSLESNGPEVKIRGTAAQIYEKYMQYARDGQSGGDRVKYENYLQHAEHYFRIMATTMPRERMQQISDNGGQQPQDQNAQDQRGSEEGNADPMKVIDEGDDQGDEAEGDEVEARDNRDSRDEDEPEGESQASGGQPQGDRDGAGRNRRRRRRNRDGQRPEGGGNGGGGGGPNNGSDPEARSALDALAAKQGALAGG